MSVLAPEQLHENADALATASAEGAAVPESRPRRLGLASRLLALTLAAVLLTLGIVYVMRLSVSRENYLGERLVAAETAAMMFGVRPPSPLSEDLTNKILEAIDVKALTLSAPDGKVTLSRPDAPAKPDYVFDNTDPGLFEGIGAAMQALFAPSGSTLKVTGTGTLSSQRIDITIDQTSLTTRLWRLSRNFFILSIIISAALMAVLWAALWVMVIRPVRRLTSSIIAFGADPQDTRRVIMPSGRHDDIGCAEAALAEMQGSLAHELSQRKRLAELGMAVARINHDLRNMLTAAQLMSDRLATIADPLAQRLAPQLVATLDRAIEFCQSTLTYGGARERAPIRRRFDLREVVRLIVETAEASGTSEINFAIDIPPNFEICADPEHVRRVFENLSRNAMQALKNEGERGERPAAMRFAAIRVSASEALIEVSDSGPGFPAEYRAHIFEPFHSSARDNGSGLGLAIANDLVHRNGGSIRLAPAEPGDFYCGARFLITLPTPPTPDEPRRSLPRRGGGMR